MASWLKGVLFGRQLSHGSANEDPQTFEEAFQPQLVQNVVNVEEVSSSARTSLTAQSKEGRK